MLELANEVTFSHSLREWSYDFVVGLSNSMCFWPCSLKENTPSTPSPKHWGKLPTDRQERCRERNREREMDRQNVGIKDQEK
jgi:hypothetical protein